MTVLGGGLAGSAAAIALAQQGVPVRLVERSKFPRHKVCGEFLSPGIQPALERLGLLPAFLAARPAVIRRLALHFGSRASVCNLPEQGFGLSRYTFDDLLFRSAARSGAIVAAEWHGGPEIIATGRRSHVPRGRRLFGFKAHYEGPADDAVELFFFNGMYVGINCIEGGLTNVCGLAPEEELRRIGFDPDELVRCSAALKARVSPLRRSMDWMFTGPLEFAHRLRTPHSRSYLAGDALSFVDPFTGSGMLSAVLTGALAGQHAARRSPVEKYLADCRRCMEQPFGIASILRRIALSPAAEYLVRLVPGEWLFRWTRPRSLV